MIPLIIWLTGCFLWLLYETDFLRVRLLVGAPIIESCPWFSGMWFVEFDKVMHYGYAYELFNVVGEWNGHSDATYKHYKIELSAGVKPMCEQKWLDKHYHDLDDFAPHIEFSVPGYKQSMTLRDETKLKPILSANFRGKKELKARISA